ncbi:G-type lectin S-receptor-like serine/threonine-protein kinase At4g27290 [Cynara cardunculus var. scolymus]|uniref:G-type lectin S-receptor-like serine/threonine-protein kinase At4g27290 n=1 Tax=Cynara cardunculus var. scolymus TaxID=59895 RepID=UPI000D6250B9|nr:G-type lectin S-receptor-like serine/threonine-protein kinase At4g27290 [Cynara cardunculus var. scolymus]
MEESVTTTTIFLLFSLLHFHKVHTAELATISDSQFLTDEDTLVSPAGIFELGFFRPAPGRSENRYLGIWYKKISIKTVVWVANRDFPITGAPSHHVLKIADPGILVLMNNITVVWTSPNTTITSPNATAKLHDTGNLVVVDVHKNNIWQSFDHPTDTLLPAMKFGKDLLNNKEWYLSSWRSNQDPNRGEFTWRFDTRSYPQNQLKQGEMVRFREALSGDSTVSNLLIAYDVVINSTEVTFTYNVVNSSIILRSTLSSYGKLENLMWVEDGKRWQLLSALPRDICDTYNICSSYGSCRPVTSQRCVCLDETRFVPRNPKSWETADWSGGCVRRTPLNCEDGSDGFMKYSNVKLPDTQSCWFNRSMMLKECETKCLMNCSCMAYSNTDAIDGGGCLLWFNDLVDITEVSASMGGREIFVRMASSEFVVPSVSKTKKGSNIRIILLVPISGALLIGFISAWLWYRRKKRNQAETTGKDIDQLPLFSFSQISNATASFSLHNKLGEGGFGPVYKGMLEEGLEIAVKRLSKTSSQGVDEFKNEVICISKLQHRNLVKLLGCCIHGDEKMLIYEYMPNKSLDSFIFDKRARLLLDWPKRFNIIKGIARGLVYLHQDSRLRIIHRDLKASNILLDLDMNPKISDFGIARRFGGNETEANTERVVGTNGYMSPEYALDGLFSIKSDVFSFGVLLLEIVSGKRNRGFIHPEHDNNLIGHAWSVYNEGRSMELIDASLAESCDSFEVLRSIKVGLLCVQQNAGDRPNMPSVVMMLGGEGALPQPKQPAFFMERELHVTDFSSSSYPGGSLNDLTITQLNAR